MAVDSNIIKFPREMFGRSIMRAVDGSLHPWKPRRSKNGIPEKRAAKSAVVAPAAPDRIDGRKLRGNPLREQSNLISPAVTIVGKMYTAELKKASLSPAESQGWLQDLKAGAAAARLVADGLEKAAEGLARSEAKEVWLRLPSHLQQIAAKKIQEMIDDNKKEDV